LRSRLGPAGFEQADVIAVDEVLACGVPRYGVLC
jgi:hypothetical protein